MVVSSAQRGACVGDIDCREIDGVGLEPIGDRVLDESGTDLDLGQLDGLVLPRRSNGECGDCQGYDQQHSQNKCDDLYHSLLLTFFVGSTTQMDGAFARV